MSRSTQNSDVIVSELTPRQGAVLRALVLRYIESAAPVGSGTLARSDFSSVSSATIRNDFSVLEAAGLIFQPHTSAGRVPSQLGYRVFVERLLPEAALPENERHTILHQFSQVEQDVDEWLRIATSTLAQASRSAAVVSGVVAPQCRLQTFELVPIDTARALLVVITVDAGVMQHIWQLPRNVPLIDLRALGASVAFQCSGKTADEIRDSLRGEETSSFETLMKRELLSVLESYQERQWSVQFRDGLANVLNQPEYSRAVSDDLRRQRIVDLLNVVEGGGLLREIFPDVARQRSLRVLIGEEHPDELRNIAIVLCPYGTAEQMVGVIGVIGPTRLNYQRAIYASQYISSILSYLIQELPPRLLGEEFGKMAS
ncbi:MAG: heat-inducible transcriptional repressor HrcA [Chloroflexi bacterium]|nr:heat-inducible transcriptional repressor HrcA [Chloroflexota bacterium]